MFKARYLLPDFKPPGRIYVCLSGLEHVFGSGKGIENALSNAINYGMKTITDNKNKFNSFDFFLGIISSDTIKLVENLTLFTYHDFYIQHGNQKIARHFFRYKYPLSEKIEYFDEDTITLLYKESEFRKTTENLEDYMRRYPYLGRLEPKRGFGELFV